VIHEIEQAVVRPMQVLEHEHERPLPGKGLEVAAPGGERLATVVTAQLDAGLEPDQRAQVPLDPFRIRGFQSEGCECACQLGPRILD
jgi:hypothetical protein